MLSIRDINTNSLADVKKMEFFLTLGEDNLPHITLINSLYLTNDGESVVWGEYCRGYSKKNQQINPEVAFLAVNPDNSVQFGRAVYDHSENSGEVLDIFNAIPRFRYNATFGYSPAHFLKLKELSPVCVQDNPLLGLRAKTVAGKIHPGDAPEAFSVHTQSFFAAPANRKAIGWKDANGVLQLEMLPQCALTTGGRVVFGLAEGQDETRIPEGTDVAVFCVELQKMCNVQIKGKVHYSVVDGATFGIVDVESVYNPMMPNNCYIYPKRAVEPIREFEDTLEEFNV